MKKILSILLSLIFFTPVIVLATTTIPWTLPTGQTYIRPNLFNGVNPNVLIGNTTPLRGATLDVVGDISVGTVGLGGIHLYGDNEVINASSTAFDGVLLNLIKLDEFDQVRIDPSNIGTGMTMNYNGTGLNFNQGGGGIFTVNTTGSIPNFSLNNNDVTFDLNRFGTFSINSVPDNLHFFFVDNLGNIGIGTTTPGSILSIGDTGNDTININTLATSTFGSGLNIRTGCYAINGTCLSSSGGSGTVTSVATNNGLTGGTITTTGTIGLDISSLSTNALTAWDGSKLVATGTPALTVGYLISTTTASSTFVGPISSPALGLIIGSKTVGVNINPYYSQTVGGTGGVIIGTTTDFSLPAAGITGATITTTRNSALAVVGSVGTPSTGDLSGNTSPVIYIQGGKGANSSSGFPTATGGQGAGIYLKTGDGGDGSGGSFGSFGGRGGPIYIGTGAQGVGTSGNGSYGNIFIGQAGVGTNGNNGGSISIGSNAITSGSKLGVFGSAAFGSFAVNTAPSNGIIVSGRSGFGIIAPTAQFEVSTTSLGITQSTISGIAVTNTTDATAILNQISPEIRWSAKGWKTDATAASQNVEFRAFVSPVTGTANPTGYLGFGSAINSGAYNDNQLVLTSAGNIGIGTTSPYASTSIQSNSSVNDAFVVATSSANTVFGIDNDGHQFTSGPAPAISSCGTGSGTVVGDDQSGTITTATAATACTMTFSKAYRATPVCIVSDDSSIGFASITSISTTAVTFGISAAITGNLYYSCSYHR